MPIKDPEARKAYMAEYRKTYLADPENRKRHNAGVASRARVKRAELKVIYETFRAQGCKYCPETDPVCLVGHHVDPSTKLFDAYYGMRSIVTVEAFNAELAKCECVCENCHRKLHAGRTMTARSAVPA